MNFIYFLLILTLILFVHELGHFLFAKKAGIYVYEFSIGMGPRIFDFKRKNDETEYGIRLFPIGGFVSMAGEQVELDEKVPLEKRMQSKTWIERVRVVIAGVCFNFLFALLLLFTIGLFYGVSSNSTKISGVETNYPFAIAGIEKGDEIVRINKKQVRTSDSLLLELQVHLGETIEVEVRKKNGSYHTYSIKPMEVETENGKTYTYGFSLENTVKKGFFEAIGYGFSKTVSLFKQMIDIVIYLVTGKLSLSNLSGPIGIFQVVGESAQGGLINLMYLTALISINVGFMNLIPLPAFDGGRLFFMIIEKIKGKPVNPDIENRIHAIGLMALMVLMVFVTYNDIIRLFK